MNLFRPWFFLKYFYPGSVFRIKTKEKVLFLTFDNGPNPGSTDKLIAILLKHNIKALFFCSGKAAEKNLRLMEKLKNNGHLIGNHGYNHWDGFKTPVIDYLIDVSQASEFTSEEIFRPPYGHMKIEQFKEISRQYKVVFWDLMAYDFNPTFGPAKSLRVLKFKIRPGSIIVLHDTLVSSANSILEEFIKFSVKAGYRFELLNPLQESKSQENYMPE